MEFASMVGAFAQIGPAFSLAPFTPFLQPLMDEVLREQGQDKFRQGTLLIPKLLIWLVLVLTLRRDLNCQKALSWMVSGFRWMKAWLPAQATIVQDGAISHARVKLGVEVFRLLWAKLIASFQPLEPDFHGRVTVIFDGTTGTMPDTAENGRCFHKPKSRKGQAAFPQVRIVTLLARSARLILELAYAPYRGKGTGERALMQQILARVGLKHLLFLLDAGLYSFKMLWTFDQQDQAFIVKVPQTVHLKPFKTLPDGSFLAEVVGQIEDPAAPKTQTGRTHWKTVHLTVRVIRFEVPGFRPVRLMTNLLDAEITARELVVHYHQRWDAEVAYDEIKTHQCATLRGQSPTTFRSKRPDLVEQELYALVIMYNLVRLLIRQAATEQGKDPRRISFLDALQHILDATPIMTAADAETRSARFEYLLSVIADCDLDRPDRHRVSPRVVKVKMSKFQRKNDSHKSEYRDLERDLTIIWECPEPTQDVKVGSLSPA
jgi:hypothetical protein